MTSMFPLPRRRDDFYDTPDRPETRPRIVFIGVILLAVGAALALFEGMVLLSADMSSVTAQVADAARELNVSTDDAERAIRTSIRTMAVGALALGVLTGLFVGPIAQGSHRARVAAIVVIGIGALFLMIGFVIRVGGIILGVIPLLLIIGLLCVFSRGASPWFR